MKIKSVFKYLKSKLSHYKQILPYYIGDGSFSFYPKTIYLVVNSICNLRCVMCDIGQKNKESQFYQLMNRGDQELDFYKLKAFIDQVKSFKPIIAITSTEPLLYKPLVDLIKYIKSKDLFVQVTTNGFLLSEFAEKLIDAGLDELWISLDGISRINDQIRGVDGSFQKALDGMKKITKIKDETKKNHPKLFLNFTISNLNTSSILEFVDFFKDKGIESITVSHLNFVTAKQADIHNKKFGHIGTSTPSGISAVDPKAIDIDILFKQISQVKEKFSKDKVFFSPDIGDKLTLEKFYNEPQYVVARDKCLMPWICFQVLSDGSATLMTRCFNLILGNIYTQSFKDIWHGSEFKKIRRALKKHKLFPVCTRCCAVF